MDRLPPLIKTLFPITVTPGNFPLITCKSVVAPGEMVIFDEDFDIPLF